MDTITKNADMILNKYNEAWHDGIKAEKDNMIYIGDVFIRNAGNNLKYVIYKDDEYYTARCLDINVSSFGITVEEAHDMIKEALELYFQKD